MTRVLYHPPETMSYVVGLDLAQSSDYTALCVIELPVWFSADTLAEYPWASVVAGWNSPSAIPPQALEHALTKQRAPWPSRPALHVVHMDRWRHASYVETVSRVVNLLNGPPLRGRVALVLDQTGVGAAVSDLFFDRLPELGDIPIVPITITGGERQHGLSVPKKDLVSAVQVALGTGRLKIAGRLEHAETLKKELEAFKIKVNLRGHEQYEAWREKDHDDLVLATALAVWWRDWYFSDAYSGIDSGRMQPLAVTRKDQYR